MGSVGHVIKLRCVRAGRFVLLVFFYFVDALYSAGGVAWPFSARGQCAARVIDVPREVSVHLARSAV